jgi:uncharacterized protein YcbK (DUF882 family)
MSQRSRRKGLFGVSSLVALALGMVAATATRSPALQSIIPAIPLSIQRGVTIEPLPSPEIPLELENVNSGETISLSIMPGGYISLEQAAAYEDFFRCRRTNKHMPLAQGVLALLADVAQHWPGKVIEIVSGFRAPPYGVPHSRHFQGHAIDLRVRGVRTSVLRDYLWREHQNVGVGFYSAENFVHMDWRPEAKDTAWSATDEEGELEYNPRWAYTARHPRPARGVRHLAMR